MSVSDKVTPKIQFDFGPDGGPIIRKEDRTVIKLSEIATDADGKCTINLGNLDEDGGGSGGGTGTAGGTSAKESALKLIVVEFRIRSYMYVVFFLLMMSMGWECWDGQEWLFNILLMALALVLRGCIFVNCEIDQQPPTCWSRTRNCCSATLIWIVTIIALLSVLIFNGSRGRITMNDGDPPANATFCCSELFPCDTLHLFPLGLFALDMFCYLGLGIRTLKAVIALYKICIDPNSKLHTICKWVATLLLVAFVTSAITLTSMQIHAIGFSTDMDLFCSIPFVVLTLFWIMTLGFTLVKKCTGFVLLLGSTILSLLCIVTALAWICHANYFRTSEIGIEFGATWSSWLKVSLLHLGVFLLFILSSMDPINKLSRRVQNWSTVPLAIALLPIVLVLALTAALIAALASISEQCDLTCNCTGCNFQYSSVPTGSSNRIPHEVQCRQSRPEPRPQPRPQPPPRPWNNGHPWWINGH